MKNQGDGNGRDQPNSPIGFTAKDLDILARGVSIHANLEYACYAAKLARQHLTFPIHGYEELAPLFKIKGIPERIAKRQVRKADMRKFFPKVFFPIDDIFDFLGKTLAALSWGDRVHTYERFLKHPPQFMAGAQRRDK